MPDVIAPPPWVLVCGGFHRLGGMDRANLALAEALLQQGREIFLVGHRFAPELVSNLQVHASIVPRPMGVLMAESALRRTGMRVAEKITRRFPEARVVVNGGNCPWPDMNWVHLVHAAAPTFDAQAPTWFRTKARIAKQKGRRDELYALRRAKRVIANSELTRRELVTIGIPDAKIETIYLGSEPEWLPATEETRRQARRSFNLPEDAAIVSFAGGLGYDRRKGLDTLLASWKGANLQNAILVAAGAGRGFIQWRRQIEKLGLLGRVRLLGFTDRAGDLYDASDLFVSPTRYEPFGMNVLEALCRGVPSIVSKAAGIAELYPPELSRYLLHNPDDVGALTRLLLSWRSQTQTARDEFAPLAAKLRAYTMHDMARKIIEMAEAHS